MKRIWLFLLLILVHPDMAMAQGSQFGNNFVLSGATCPPVNPPANTGTIYTCTGTGALYNWNGSAWLLVSTGGGAVDGSGAATQVSYWSDANTITGTANLTFNGATIAESILYGASPPTWGTPLVMWSVDVSDSPMWAARIPGFNNNSNAGEFLDATVFSQMWMSSETFGGIVWDTAINWDGTGTAPNAVLISPYVATETGTTNPPVTKALIYISPYGGLNTGSFQALKGVTIFGVDNDFNASNRNGVYMFQVYELHGGYTAGFPDSVSGVGINTTTPSGPLHVKNPITNNDDDPKNYVVATIEGRADQVADLMQFKLTGGSTLTSVSAIGTVTAPLYVVSNGGAIATDTTTAHTALLRAYDNDTGPAYVTFGTLTNGNSPSFVISPPTGGSTVSLTANAFATSSTTSVAVANVGANSCGTSAASIAGNDTVGAVTVGATSATQCRITFTVAAATRRHCVVSDETTAAVAATLHTAYVDSTHTDILGTITAADVITYNCWAR